MKAPQESLGSTKAASPLKQFASKRKAAADADVEGARFQKLSKGDNAQPQPPPARTELAPPVRAAVAAVSVAATAAQPLRAAPTSSRTLFAGQQGAAAPRAPSAAQAA